MRAQQITLLLQLLACCFDSEGKQNAYYGNCTVSLARKYHRPVTKHSESILLLLLPSLFNCLRVLSVVTLLAISLQLKLLGLLNTPSESIQKWAATRLIRYDESVDANAPNKSLMLSVNWPL